MPGTGIPGTSSSVQTILFAASQGSSKRSCAAFLRARYGHMMRGVAHLRPFRQPLPAADAAKPCRPAKKQLENRIVAALTAE
jgi:hypothetical protein